jgi:predicted transcriptional regulator
MGGIHWRKLDEDISFESFAYEDAEPTPLQKFFLTHKEINVSEFAKIIGINASLLRNYINGFKKPSKEREEEILNHIHNIGKEYMLATF